MITETHFQGTEFSDLVYPALTTFVDKAMKCDSSGDKIGQVLVIKIPITYMLKDYKTKKEYEVFKASSKYTLITDGKLTVEQLYEVFVDAMQIMLTALNQLEKQSSLPETKELLPVSLEMLRSHLKYWTDKFLGK